MLTAEGVYGKTRGKKLQHNSSVAYGTHVFRRV